MNDLLFTQGGDNVAGLVGEIYLCPVEDIATLPALTAASSLKTAVANITCGAGKKFSRLYFTDETGKVETKSVGERDGKGRETILSCRYPKVGQALADFISDCQNTPSVLVYRQLNTGKLYLLGVTRLDKTNTALSKELPAYFEAGDSSSGEKRADQNGALLSWKFTCAHDPIEYAGTVPLVAA
ncbi:MAG TPA: hypothetical protein VGK59_10885 [Ohtaekwangia sp.]